MTLTRLPVLGLVNALRIGPCEAALTVQSSDGGAELGHWMQVCGEVIQHGDHMGGKCCSLGPLFGHPVHLGRRKHKIMTICTADILYVSRFCQKLTFSLNTISATTVSRKGPQFQRSVILSRRYRARSRPIKVNYTKRTKGKEVKALLSAMLSLYHSSVR